MAFTSTVPAALTALYGYMQTIAATLPAPVDDLNVFFGYSTPLSGMGLNFMMVGNYEEGVLWQPIEEPWEALPVQGKMRREKYAINGCIHTAAGGEDWQSRLNDAFTLYNLLHNQILADPGIGGTVTGSGSWGQLSARNLGAGPFEGTGGWGVVIDFELQVLNAIPQG